ncbi:MAG: cobyrinic acid a,c-diamide synthase, partial [Thermodesulfobacteriota bacterium]|nr:cobyrinic acid a,c-diamide synthase [Thermodesulfobacteriota bacterium]
EKNLPDLDGLYIGGGFPETSAKELAANRSFRESVKAAAENGLPIYAECGGLIYLGTSIEFDGEVYPLAGVFPVRFGMSKKPQAHGYSIFEADGDNPFYQKGIEVKGHEFRYSTILEWPGKSEKLALKMKRGVGFTDGRDGLNTKNVLALYTHVHALGTPEWAEGFLKRCREVKADQRSGQR